MTIGEIVMCVGGAIAIILSIVLGIIYWKTQDWGWLDSNPLNLVIKISVVAFFAGFALAVFGV